MIMMNDGGTSSTSAGTGGDRNSSASVRPWQPATNRAKLNQVNDGRHGNYSRRRLHECQVKSAAGIGYTEASDEKTHEPLRNRSPVPIHYVCCHNKESGEQGSVLTLPPESRNHGKIASKSSTLYWAGAAWKNVGSEESTVYPGIPFQVAKYLCESNPELVERMEAALHVSIGSSSGTYSTSSTTTMWKLNADQSLRPSATETSPLDALALQQSVIGGPHVRHAQPDVVAHVPVKMKSLSNCDDAGRDQDQCSKELLRFPKERITTLVERRSWFSAGSEEMIGTTGTSSLPVSFNGRTDGEDEEHEPALEVEVATIDEGRWAASESELESNLSERSSDIRSIVSESNQGQGNHLLDVLRENATLEGQLEIVKLEAERCRDQSVSLQSQLATARAQMAAQTALSRASGQEVDNMRRMLDDAARRLNDSEDLAVGLREALDARAVEVVQSRTESREAESEAQALRISLQEAKVDAESRQGAVVGLKAKVVEMHASLEEATRGRSHAECELQACKRECDSESKMKEWYRSQVERIQDARQSAQRDALAATADAAEARASAQRLRFEGDRLGKQLADVQQRAVREKENLLRHLETIEADIQEREAAVQQHLNQLEGVGDGGALVQRIKAVEEERARLAEEAFSRTQLEHQLDVARKELSERAESQMRAEREAAALASRVVVLQNTVDDGRLELNAASERHSRLEGKCREMESSLRRSDDLVSTLRHEKSSLEVELSAAKRERCNVDSALVDVQANVTKLDGRIRRLREELIDKSRCLDALTQEKSRLEDELAIRDTALDQRRRRETRLEEEMKELREKFRRMYRKNASNSFGNHSSNEELNPSVVDDDEMTNVVHVERHEVGCQTTAIQVEDIVKREMVSASERRRTNSTIALLTRKLKEVKDANKRLEADLEAAAIGRLSVDRLEVETSFYKKELEETQRMYEEEKRRADRNQTLLIDTEKEKGRLHALMESTETLRLHATALEATLAERENEVRALETLTVDSVERNRRELMAKDQRIDEVEKRLGLEQSTNRDLRRQVFKEMCEAKGLRKNLSNTKELIEETGRHLDTSRARLQTMENEAMANGNAGAQLRVERNELESQLCKANSQVDCLRKELEECRAKDEMLADQIKSIGWHLHQKNQEIVCLQSESKAAEERHAVELEATREASERFKHESEVTAAELRSCSKEKFAYQARAKALKANAGTGTSDVESPTPYNESLVASLLQQSLRSLPESRRPLMSHLRLCLDTLKQEMAILQRQLQDND